jgi:hypothetical protein
MSSPQPPHPTRQQLDELDALLRHMLDAPEDAPAAPPAEVPAPPPGPAVSYRVIQQASPAPPAPAPGATPEEDEQWVPLRSAWQPSAQTWGPLAESWQQAQSGRGAPPAPAAPEPASPPPEPEAAAPPPIIRPVSGFVQRAPEPIRSEELAAPPEPRWLLPLVWCNRGFDALTAPLGAPGRWLRGRVGRNVLGAVGLLCLAAAVARAVADGIGWTW